MEPIATLELGEIGSDRNAQISKNIINASVDLTSTMTSQLSLIVYDPGFKMMKANYFQLRRPVSYRGLAWEIAAAVADRAPGAPDTVKLQCRSGAIQRMRRDKGAKTWNLSASGFASAIADEFGLKKFIQKSAGGGSITRQSGDNADESTWDVLTRVASDNEFVCFESYGVLYFTSEEFLVERQPGIVVDVDAPPDAPWYPYSWQFTASDDDWRGSNASLLLPRENAKKLRPGMSVQFLNVGVFGPTNTSYVEDVQTLEDDSAPITRKYLITQIKWTEGENNPVQVMARTIVETDDTAGDTSVGTGVYTYGSRVLRRGLTGSDVKRLQMAIGMPEKEQDGIFGPITESFVKTWQQANKLGQKKVTFISALDPADRSFFGAQTKIVTYEGDGIIDDDDWKILLRYPAQREDEHPMLHGDLFDASIAEALAEHEYDLIGRDVLDSSLAVPPTIPPDVNGHNDGAEEISPPISNVNHPMYGTMY